MPYYEVVVEYKNEHRFLVSAETQDDANEAALRASQSRFPGDHHVLDYVEVSPGRAAERVLKQKLPTLSPLLL